MVFKDRRQAGERLAEHLLGSGDQRPVVLALPRGGVSVGFEVAKRLKAPLDVVLVRKIGHPLYPEFAIGAIADGGALEVYVDDHAAAGVDIPGGYIQAEIDRQAREIERRRQLYYAGGKPVDIRDCTALVVDDGIATGATMRAAVRSVRRRSPRRLVIAVPVASPTALANLSGEADEIVCLAKPENFAAVGEFYADFRPVENETVVALLDRAAAEWGG